MRLYERPVIVKDGKVVGYQHADQRLANSDIMYNYITQNYTAPKNLAEYQSQNQSMIQQPDALRVSTIKPLENTHYRLEGAENVSPYITGKPMLKIPEQINYTNIPEVMEQNKWKPVGFPNYKCGKNAILPKIYNR